MIISSQLKKRRLCAYVEQRSAKEHSTKPGHYNSLVKVGAMVIY